jgi:GxxExxY protein
MSVDLDKLNPLTDSIIGAALAVHRGLGPGLLESAYIACLVYELREAGLSIVTQRPVLVEYGEVRLDCAYRLDLLVNDHVVVEVKSVKRLLAIHEAQLLTYLKLSGYPAGLLFNFNVELLVHGIRRRLNPKPASRFMAEPVGRAEGAATGVEGEGRSSPHR